MDDFVSLCQKNLFTCVKVILRSLTLFDPGGGPKYRKKTYCSSSLISGSKRLVPKLCHKDNNDEDVEYNDDDDDVISGQQLHGIPPHFRVLPPRLHHPPYLHLGMRQGY